MGMFSMCPNCGSDWCSGCECCRISPENLRKLAVQYRGNNMVVISLQSLADYFEKDKERFQAAMKELEK